MQRYAAMTDSGEEDVSVDVSTVRDAGDDDWEDRHMVVFKDPGVQPTPGLIEDALDDAAPCWTMLTDHFADVGAPVEWRYYREGGWLGKAVGKGRTVGWLSVEDGYVSLTCYFAERHRLPLLGDESLAKLHPAIAQTPLSGRLLPVTLEVRSTSDVGTAYHVIAAKIRMK